MQIGNVYRNDVMIGEVSKDDSDTYRFLYTLEYIGSKDALSISVNFPLQEEPFESDVMFSFFFNMLAEGNIKDIQCRDMKIDPDDHFTRLLKTAHSNTIGSVTVKEAESDEMS